MYRRTWRNLDWAERTTLLQSLIDDCIRWQGKLLLSGIGGCGSVESRSIECYIVYIHIYYHNIFSFFFLKLYCQFKLWCTDIVCCSRLFTVGLLIDLHRGTVRMDIVDNRFVGTYVVRFASCSSSWTFNQQTLVFLNKTICIILC